MALRLVQVVIKAGALHQDLRDNRCHHHSGAQTTVDLPNNRVMGLMGPHRPVHSQGMGGIGIGICLRMAPQLLVAHQDPLKAPLAHRVICILVDQHLVQLHQHLLVLQHLAVLRQASKSRAIMELVMAVTVATRIHQAMVEEGIMLGMVPVKQGAVTPAIPLCQGRVMQVCQAPVTLGGQGHSEAVTTVNPAKPPASTHTAVCKLNYDKPRPRYRVREYTHVSLRSSIKSLLSFLIVLILRYLSCRT